MAVNLTKPYISPNFQNPAFGYGYNGVSSQKSYNNNVSSRNIKENPPDNKEFFNKNSNLNPAVNTGADNKNTIDKGKATDKQNDSTKGKTTANDSSKANGLTEKELRIIASLKARDTKVRRHEMAHIAAGGQYITSGAHYQYEKGPDGNNYAVAGDVSIDTSPVPGDPEATIAKMHKVERAALAPADPSPQDKKVAAESAFVAAKALSDLMIMQAKQRTATRKQQFQSYQKSPASAVKAYEKTSMAPVQNGTGFDIAA